jgi:hypothetical protein
MNNVNPVRIEPLSEEECHEIISKAYADGKEVCRNLGLKNLNECNPLDFFRPTVLSAESQEETNQYLEESYGVVEEFDDFEGLNVATIEINGKQILKFKNIYFIDEPTGNLNF